MIARQELAEEFGQVRDAGSGVVFFQDKIRGYTCSYWLAASRTRDLIVVTETDIDDELALIIVGAVPDKTSCDRPTIIELPNDSSRFTHVIVAPSTYHSYLKGLDRIDRSNLLLCIPIFRCEFSGNELPEEFRELRQRSVPTLNWKRKKHPKLLVYFDNPKTGAGTEEQGAYLQIDYLFSEIENLHGVENGFVELTNWEGRIVELLWSADDKYRFIVERQDEHELSRQELLGRVMEFACN
jgi:hypothetical protein